MSPAYRILGIVLAVALTACSDRDLSSGAELPPTPEASQTPELQAQTQASPTAQDHMLGTGFVVWESNRADTGRRGAWRLWRKDFSGRNLKAVGSAFPLTPGEPSRAHCCAHIAPDGRSLVYLSLPVGQAAYPKNGAVGELRRLDLTSSGDSGSPQLGEALAPRARTYFEHRAAVWRGSQELIWIDGDGRTVLKDLATESTKVLVSQGGPAHGWLMNPTLTFASRGTPTFSPYDAASRKVQALDKLGGCQPYFSADGRLGVWVAGAGGPIRAIDLASRRQWPILNKGDERLPGSHRYLYFPMPSSDGYALAWAGSNDEHDHTRADYDVFVAATDPQTLELVGSPVRISRHPATDRFPSVWLQPMELGRHSGEAPLTVQLDVPTPPGSEEDPGPWIWDLNGGDADTSDDGPSMVATWRKPGRYEVTARSPSPQGDRGSLARGWIHVRPARAPQLVGSELRNRGMELHLKFDEPIQVDDADVEIQAKAEIQVTGQQLDQSGTIWQLKLSAPIQRPTQVVLRSVSDRASQPNVLSQTKLRVEPPRWPTVRRDLVFLWQSARHANRITAGGDHAGEARTTILEPKGRSFVDRWGRMVLRGGAFQADPDTMDRLFLGLKAGNELTLELTFVADRGSTHKPGALFSFAAGTQRNLIVTQEGNHLKLRLRTPSSGKNADRPVVDLGRVRPGVAQHLVVMYSPGRLRAYLDGAPTADTQELKSGFFHWQRTWLRLGAMGPPDGDGRRFPWSWPGTLEGIAVYDRPLSTEEAASHHRRYQQLRERRDTVDRQEVTARLLRRSPTPSLQEIAPYREALAVFEYQDSATGKPIHVVHRVLLDGQETPMAGLQKGATVSLSLEPFDAQPQLESLFLSNNVDSNNVDGDGKLYWSDRLDP